MLRRSRPSVSFMLAAVLLVSGVGRAANGQDRVDTSYGDSLVHAYFERQVREIQDGWLDGVADQADWAEQLPRRRQELLRMVGLDPMPARSDLEPVVTGRLEHDEFFVEKLHFQSMPGLYVTANLYLPKQREGLLPGVLYVCGHANNTSDGMSHGSKTAYQRHAAWYARHGYVALIIDTSELGEIEGVHHGTYRYDRWWWWNRGYTPLGVETWNGIRALDYLATRPEVDPARLAVTGRSGGGMYSWLITALDHRVKASVPTAGITDLADYVNDGVVAGHCDCMFTINSYRWDFPMISALAAPRPILLANGDVDPIFPLDGVMRVCDRTRHVYALHGMLDAFDHLIVEAAHEDVPPLQQATYRWMHRHVKASELQADAPAVAYFEPEELRVFDELPRDAINTRIDEVFVQPAPEPPVPQTRARWLRLRGEWIERLSEQTFAGWPSERPSPDAEPVQTLEAADLRITAFEFDSQDDVRLRMWTVEPAQVQPTDTLVVSVIDASGWSRWLSIVRAAAPDDVAAASLLGPGASSTVWPDARRAALETVAARLVAERVRLVVVAPRGVGPTKWTETERGYGIRRSFMLLGQTVESMQAWDVQQAMRAALRLPAVGSAAASIEAQGSMAGVALYAALFQDGVSALELYDLPDTHRDGPIFLNVRRTLDVPQAVAAALESTDSVRLLSTGETTSPATRAAWSWPLQLEAHGAAAGSLTIEEGIPWLVGSDS